MTLRSGWPGTQMCSSPEAVSTSALELFLLLEQSPIEGEVRKNSAVCASLNSTLMTLVGILEVRLNWNDLSMQKGHIKYNLNVLLWMKQMCVYMLITYVSAQTCVEQR